MGRNHIDYLYTNLVTGLENTRPDPIPYSKVIFISGPYRDIRGEYYVNQNIQTARAYSLAVWRMGGVAICPHLNTMLFGGAEGIEDSVWLMGDLEILSRCDAIFMIQGWEHSEGSQREKSFAENNGIPVLRSIEEVARFLLS